MGVTQAYIFVGAAMSLNCAVWLCYRLIVQSLVDIYGIDAHLLMAKEMRLLTVAERIKDSARVNPVLDRRL